MENDNQNTYEVQGSSNNRSFSPLKKLRIVPIIQIIVLVFSLFFIFQFCFMGCKERFYGHIGNALIIFVIVLPLPFIPYARKIKANSSISLSIVISILALLLFLSMYFD